MKRGAAREDISQGKEVPGSYFEVRGVPHTLRGEGTNGHTLSRVAQTDWGQTSTFQMESPHISDRGSEMAGNCFFHPQANRK